VELERIRGGKQERSKPLKGGGGKGAGRDAKNERNGLKKLREKSDEGLGKKV